MKTSELQASIVVSVSGGVVNGIFGPDGATVLLVDFDNLAEGDTLEVCDVDGTTNSEACRATLTEALEVMAKHKTEDR